MRAGRADVASALARGIGTFIERIFRGHLRDIKTKDGLEDLWRSVHEGEVIGT